MKVSEWKFSFSFVHLTAAKWGGVRAPERGNPGGGVATLPTILAD